MPCNQAQAARLWGRLMQPAQAARLWGRLMQQDAGVFAAGVESKELTVHPDDGDKLHETDQ